MDKEFSSSNSKYSLLMLLFPIWLNEISFLLYLAVVPIKKLSNYNASKAALSHMARTIALEEAPNGIRVNMVCPGFTATEALPNLGIQT